MFTLRWYIFYHKRATNNSQAYILSLQATGTA